MGAVHENEGVGVRRAVACLLCGAPGATLYDAQRDRMFAAPGTWSLRRCPACHLVWLDPRPVPQDVRLLYARYHTHAAPVQPPAGPRPVRDAVWRAVLAGGFGYTQLSRGPASLLIGRALAGLDPVRDLVGAPIHWLPASARGVLLDVGCGSGGFLAQMRSLGWDVRGVEPDPAAAEVARAQGLDVSCGTLEGAGFPERSFDVVTLGHVVEHLPDPVGTLEQCGRVLRRGGRIVVVTPNADSLGARVWRSAWRGLEVPRHLQLFSPSTLRRAVERAGLRVTAVRTTANSARWMWLASRRLRHGALPGGAPPPASRGERLAALAFWAVERALVVLRPAGEEVVLQATTL